jgi:hypothetical protein
MWDNNVGAVPVVDLAGVITNRVPPEKGTRARALRLGDG